LIQAACQHLRAFGAGLAQCLVPDKDLSRCESLLRNGFVHVTGLSYLRHDLSLTTSWLEGNDRLHLTPYDPTAPRPLHAPLEASYEQTLDWPEVNGLRRITQVIEGHQSQGRFDAGNWWLAWLNGIPVGVLLLMEQGPGEWEVVYMGVVAAARRRG